MDLTNPEEVSCYSPSECDGHLATADGTPVPTTSHLAGFSMFVGPDGSDHQECLTVSEKGGELYVRTVTCVGKKPPICQADCGGETERERRKKSTCVQIGGFLKSITDSHNFCAISKLYYAGNV